ncbi:hypothetical protein HDK77DRAFT_457562 [Phyllosticta capitalensis]
MPDHPLSRPRRLAQQGCAQLKRPSQRGDERTSSQHDYRCLRVRLPLDDARRPSTTPNESGGAAGRRKRGVHISFLLSIFEIWVAGYRQVGFGAWRRQQVGRWEPVWAGWMDGWLVGWLAYIPHGRLLLIFLSFVVFLLSVYAFKRRLVKQVVGEG